MNPRLSFIGRFLFLLGTIRFICGRMHSLTVSNDERSVIILSDFGFLKGGYLKVNITNLRISTPHHPKIGFSFDKSSSSGSSSYVERNDDYRGCSLDYDSTNAGEFVDVPRAIMNIASDPDNIGRFQLRIHTRLLNGLKFYASEKELRRKPSTERDDVTSRSISAVPIPKDKGKPKTKEVDEVTEAKSPSTDDATKTKLISDVAEKISGTYDQYGAFVTQDPLPIHGDLNGMNIVFYTKIESDDQSGLYELYFHNCENSKLYNYNQDKEDVAVGFTVDLVEKNGESYLSACDIMMPLMYGVTSFMFFAVGVIWVNLIHTRRERAFVIHYLMAVLVFAKGLSVMFHSLNYYFISTNGRSEAWGIIFYFVHGLKNVLLIYCLLLIGSGWSFAKPVLTGRDRALLVIAIPMQVIANVAYVVIEEVEQGSMLYGVWKDVAILFDLLCAALVFIPVLWSIRHFNERSRTDGESVNLAKLFKHFYIMVVCYLWFTRILVYLLIISTPFQYLWIPSLFEEMVSCLFFVVTGYKFRPRCDRVYLKLERNDSDSDDETGEISLAGMTDKKLGVN